MNIKNNKAEFNNFQRLLSASLCVVFINTTIACSQPNDLAKPRTNLNPANNDITGSQLSAQMKPMDPSESTAAITTQPALGPASEGGDLKVPVIGLELNKSDYVMMLRCPKSFVPNTPQGVDSRTIAESGRNLGEFKFVWVEAFQYNSGCRQVGNFIARTRFEDLAAKSGEFYYILNPCLSKERSTLPNETCSYNLVFSNSIQYTNNLSAVFLSEAEKLSAAEASLAGLFSQLFFYAQSIKINQEACEDQWAFSQSRSAFFSGLVGLISMGVGAAVGGVMSGGAAAFNGAKTGLGIARALFPKRQTQLQCPVAKDMASKAEEVTTRIEGAQKAVLDIRQKLGTLDANYAKLDNVISSSDTLNSTQK